MSFNDVSVFLRCTEIEKKIGYNDFFADSINCGKIDQVNIGYSK